VVVVASGADRVDTAAVGRELGAEWVGRADAGTVRTATGYPIGGVSPVGLDPALPVLVDQTLAGFDVVWAAAGTPHAVFPTSFSEIVHLTGGRPCSVRQR
ncbi:MAG: YbaK/EbsC family protein, partial [Acidimicrobiales bacterium]